MYFIGILLKIISSVFYLVSGLFWKKIIPNHINYHVIYHRTLFSILFSIITIFTFTFIDPNSDALSNMVKVDLSSWVATIGICCFSFYGLYFFTNALKNGRYSIVTPRRQPFSPLSRPTLFTMKTLPFFPFIGSHLKFLRKSFIFIPSYIIYDEKGELAICFPFWPFLNSMIGHYDYYWYKPFQRKAKNSSICSDILSQNSLGDSSFLNL